MTDNIKSNTGADTSTLFSTTGTKSGTSKLHNSAGQDLYAVYAVYSSGTKTTTGLHDSAGNDIGQILQPIAGGAALSASISPNPNSQGLKAAGTYNTTFTCTPSGGTGPYTYTWTASGGASIVSGASAATVTVSYTAFVDPPHGGSSNGTVTCTVHDSASDTIAPTASLTWDNPP